MGRGGRKGHPAPVREGKSKEMSFRTLEPGAPVASFVLAYTAAPGDVELWIRVRDPFASSTVLIGGDAGHPYGGFPLKATDPPLNMRVRPGDQLWIKSGTGNEISVGLLVRSA